MIEGDKSGERWGMDGIVVNCDFSRFGASIRSRLRERRMNNFGVRVESWTGKKRSPERRNDIVLMGTLVSQVQSLGSLKELDSSLFFVNTFFSTEGEATAAIGKIES
ncbi:hypothetical protein GWI33_003213 [Rhynchophorus ferrugineus]|uniref:Uncharacterized protein n=1 Tax=Rhynchophorus ferrugineus TaxID=354439 RepID=A0A834MK53_RHYFE|nr:hypothetical protein GWI33_003213 [Rhynchophorus ferrugineus]